MNTTVDADAAIASAQTLELDDETAAGDPKQTIDMNAAVAGMQTVEGDSHAKPGTVSDIGGQTIDADVDKPGTVRGEHDQTVQGAGEGSGTSRGRDATFDSSVITSQSANRLMVLWSGVNRNTRPGATIQGEEGSEDDQRQTQLVIQNRDLRDIKDITTQGADYECDAAAWRRRHGRRLHGAAVFDRPHRRGQDAEAQGRPG